MRNFKKVMALALSTAAIATSVSAAELEYAIDGLTGSYDATANALTLTVDGAAGDKTVLVLDNGVADTAATGEDILYINQYTADETAFSAMGLKGASLAVGTYAVKVGYEDANGDFAIANGTIVVSEKQDQGPKYIEVLWGDIDSDGAVAGLDASAVVNVLLGGVEETAYTIGEVVPGTEVIWGDIDSDGAVAGLDASAIVNVLLGGIEETQYTIGEVVQLPIVE